MLKEFLYNLVETRHTLNPNKSIWETIDLVERRKP